MHLELWGLGLWVTAPYSRFAYGRLRPSEADLERGDEMLTKLQARPVMGLLFGRRSKRAHAAVAEMHECFRVERESENDQAERGGTTDRD